MTNLTVNEDTDFERFVLDYLHEEGLQRSQADDYPGIFGLKALYERLNEESIRKKFAETLLMMLEPNYHNPWSSPDPLVWFATGPNQPPLVIAEVKKDDYECQFTAVVLCRLLGFTETVPALRRLGENLQTKASRYDVDWLRTQLNISLAKLS